MKNDEKTEFKKKTLHRKFKLQNKVEFDSANDFLRS